MSTISARTLALLPSLGLALSALGCPRNEAASTSTDASTGATAAASASPPDAGAAPTPRTSRRDGGHGDAGALSPKARAEVLRSLNEGRKLSRAKDWAGAMKAFDHALATEPDDVRVLSELGWAALQANDLGRAESANKRALAHAKSPKLRAPILYNVGRVAETRGDRAAAGKAYAESLALRDNAEVKKRLAVLDAGVAGAIAEAPLLPCSQPFANVGALCGCLRSRKDDVFPEDATITCEAEPSAGPLGDLRLGLVDWGAEGLGERRHLLTVREGDRVRAVAELGRDYEPGAFGIHNRAEVKGGEKRTEGGHEIVVVRSEEHDDDFNLAGLELCSHNEKRETICAIGDTPGSTKCTPPIPVEIDSGCGPGIEPDESELDDGMRREIAEIKKNATSSRAKTAWSISRDGTVTVTIREGSRDLVDANALRPQLLWR